MKLLIDIPDEYYKSIKNTAVFISGQRSGKSFINHLCNAVANGTPQETVTEFADRCRECGAKYGKLLKQKLSGDLISREAVLDTISELNAISFYEAQEDSKETYYEIRQAIKDLSPVKQEPKTGHWIDTGSGQECSECHEIQYGYDNHRFYCGNCGARMEVEQNG